MSHHRCCCGPSNGCNFVWLVQLCDAPACQMWVCETGLPPEPSPGLVIKYDGNGGTGCCYELLSRWAWDDLPEWATTPYPPLPGTLFTGYYSCSDGHCGTPICETPDCPGDPVPPFYCLDQSPSVSIDRLDGVIRFSYGYEFEETFYRNPQGIVLTCHPTYRLLVIANIRFSWQYGLGWRTIGGHVFIEQDHIFYSRDVNCYQDRFRIGIEENIIPYDAGVLGLPQIEVPSHNVVRCGAPGAYHWLRVQHPAFNTIALDHMASNESCQGTALTEYTTTYPGESGFTDFMAFRSSLIPLIPHCAVGNIPAESVFSPDPSNPGRLVGPYRGLTDSASLIDQWAATQHWGPFGNRSTIYEGTAVPIPAVAGSYDFNFRFWGQYQQAIAVRFCSPEIRPPVLPGMCGGAGPALGGLPPIVDPGIEAYLNQDPMRRCRGCGG